MNFLSFLFFSYFIFLSIQSTALSSNAVDGHHSAGAARLPSLNINVAVSLLFTR